MSLTWGPLHNPDMLPGINESFLKRGIKACLCLPMSFRESIIGVMYLHFDEEHSFSPNEIDMFYLFANQAAAAIEYIRHVDRLNSLLGISAELVSNLDHDTILKSMAKTIVELLGAERSLFLKIDRKNRCITQKTHHNYTNEHLSGLKFSQIMKGASGKVLKSGKPFWHENAQSEEVNIEEALESAKKFNTGPLIVAPLIVKRKAINSVTDIDKTTWEDDQTYRINEEIIGTLTAVRELGSPVFTKDDVELACTLANLAAIAIDNASLYNDLQNSHDQLKGYVDKLEELDRKKSDFISNVTHELLSPLSKMKSICENILQGKFDTLTMNQAKAIIEIDKYTDEEYELISNCLEFSQIEYGTTDLKKEKFSINTIIEEAFDSFRYQAEERNIEFNKSLPKKEIFTLVDIAKFSMIIRNLLHNAFKFTPNLGKISISLVKEDNNIFISVGDNGQGIPESEINKVFEKFHRVENATIFIGDKGKGIGLHIVKTLVELLEGNISVSSIPNKETVFSLIMPIKEA